MVKLFNETDHSDCSTSRRKISVQSNLTETTDMGLVIYTEAHKRFYQIILLPEIERNGGYIAR